MNNSNKDEISETYWIEDTVVTTTSTNQKTYNYGTVEYFLELPTYLSSVTGFRTAEAIKA